MRAGRATTLVDLFWFPSEADDFEGLELGLRSPEQECVEVNASLLKVNSSSEEWSENSNSVAFTELYLTMSFRSIDGNPLAYPKSRSEYDPQLFLKPSAEYRGAPLWAWNTKLDRDLLLRQIDHMEEMGMGGFHMHVRVGLDTEYLGSEFMDHVRACVEYAKGKNMLACLYDEDRWPSGAAGGLVTKGHPDFQSQHILLTRVPYGSGDTSEPPAFMGFGARSELGKLLARYDIQLNATGELLSAKRLKDNEDLPLGSNVYYAYMEPNIPSPWFNGETYVDTLNSAAISRFIDTTHEKYKSTLFKDFGQTVPSIFCDEPQFTHKTQLATGTSRSDIFLPWSQDLPLTFETAYGYEILDKLPEIVWNLPEDKPSLARYNFHDHVCERFVSAFMDQLAHWCRGNGIALTGHMMEEPFLKTQTGSLGEAMRCYRSLDLPGIDLLCDQFEYNTVKQATSVARQNGSRGAMCEIYGVTNWTFSFEGHKGCGDWQAAMGITFRVHHLTWVTMAGEAKRDFPACIGYQSPWYKEYSLIEDYFSRVNVALTRGKPLTRLAVIHPIESYWLCFGPVDGGNGEPDFREQCFRDLTHWLSHGLIDFDFISESLFPEQTPLENISKTLRVGACEYDAVFLPNLRTIRSTTLARLQRFAEAGGKVFVGGESPSLVDAVKPSKAPSVDGSISVPWTKYTILNALNFLRDIRIETENGAGAQTLLYQMREDGPDRFIFICNTERKTGVSTMVFLKGSWDIEVMDAFTGHEWTLEATLVDSWTKFPYHFDGTSSLLLHLRPSSHTASGRPQLAIGKTFGKTLGEIELQSVELSEPNVLLLDYAKFKIGKAEKWEPVEEVLRIENIVRSRLELPLKLDNFAQAWNIPQDQRKALSSVSLQFCIHSDITISGSSLAIEQAEDVIITCNGAPVPFEPSGWWVDESIKAISLPPLPAGSSLLELVYPFGLMSNLERIYLLGNFSVSLRGREASLGSLDISSLRFGDYTRQGLPFYAGNVTYHCRFHVPESKEQSGPQVAISAPQFVAPLLSLSVDGQPVGKIITEPRMLVLPSLDPGTHRLSITSFGNRENSFGTIHLPDEVTTWFGPNEFRTDRPGWWMNEYNVKRMGVLTVPQVKGKGHDSVAVQPHILRFPYERAQQRS